MNPERASHRTAAPSLLDLPASCLERIAELVMFAGDDGQYLEPRFRVPPPGAAVSFGLPPDATAEPLLACKALWHAATPLLHRCARMGHWLSRNKPFPDAAAYEEPLQAHAAALRHLTLDGPRMHATKSDRCLALAPAHLLELVLHYGSDDDRRQLWVAQLPRFTALESLSLCTTKTWLAACRSSPAAWPDWPRSLRRLTLSWHPLTDSLLASLAPLSQLSSLKLYCHSVQTEQAAQRSVACRCAGCKLRRQRLMNAVLEDASQVQPSPTLESLELVQSSTDWLLPPLVSRLSRLTALVLQCNRPEALNLSPLTALQTLCISAQLLNQVPPGVARLSRLTALDLSWNRLQALPTGPYLSSLRRLSLAHNEFVRVPAVLAAATALEAIDLTGCAQLRNTDRSVAVLSKMPALQTVHFQHRMPMWLDAEDVCFFTDKSGLMHLLEQLNGAFGLAARMQGALRRRRNRCPAALDNTGCLVIAKPRFPVDEFRRAHEAV